MKRVGFTLIELLLVISIMGLMGTAAVGGYRAMQRGMEERGVRQNVIQFVRAAHQRAQIDRVPVVIYTWNETLRGKDADGYETEIVVGKAVAVRRMGRISNVGPDNELYDEFGDLRYQSFILEDLDTSTQAKFASALEDSQSAINLYQMDGATAGIKRSVVAANTGVNYEYGLKLVSKPTEPVTMPVYYFQIIENKGATWRPGSGYGLEFAELQLPHNYLFGQTYASTTRDPVAGEATLGFLPGDGEPSDSALQVYSLRPSSTGDLTPQAIN